MPTTRGRARRAARISVLPLGAVLLAGCAFATGGAASPSSSPAEDPAAAVGADIERQLLARDDVADAEVRYRDDVTVPASAAVDVTMEPGADAEALADEAVRLVWLSALEPLHSITLEIGDPEDPPSGVSRIVDLLDDAQRDAIESEHGPRPE
ncbi:hypothetical protein [Blastococcus saxobsidens]|uniref:Uncharacterized protein n=1 Tax=Blastococcus saxobsidens TaxID=138336 RepID=A0A4Q7Y4Z0_9ACTN|nr:hypothetical protein [Blastococcus saxobsidens]RZU31151.1 hypothetical protein BKA19_0799 [Blastococcus saxobsidens]